MFSFGFELAEERPHDMPNEPSHPSGMAPAREDFLHSTSSRVAGFVLAALGLAAVAVGLTARLQPPFAPLLLLPIVVGVAVGAALRAIFFRRNLQDRRLLCAGVILASLATVGGQHYADYQQYRREYLQSARDPRWQMIEAARPDLGVPSFAGFMRAQAAVGRGWIGGVWRGPWAWATWTCDGLLLMLSATVVAVYRPATGIDGDVAAGEHKT